MNKIENPHLIWMGYRFLLRAVFGLRRLQARRIREVSPASKILFVSENRSADVAEEALSNGAGGYVVKSDAAGELLSAAKGVLEGKRFVSASLAGHFLVAATLSASQTMLSWMVMLTSGIR